MKLHKFEHKKCKTALHTGEIKEGLETKCKICHRPFLSPEDYVKITMEEEL